MSSGLALALIALDPCAPPGAAGQTASSACAFVTHACMLLQRGSVLSDMDNKLVKRKLFCTNDLMLSEGINGVGSNRGFWHRGF